MKTSLIRLLCLFFAVIPLTANAQSNIKSAFNAIIKCRDAQITETHSLDKDPSAGVKTGQCDIYRFVLPASKESLIKNVISAFDKDSDMAYGYVRGNYEDIDRDIVLTIGDGSENGVKINNPDCKYVYSLFLAPSSEDKDGIYRYAYAISWKEEGRELVGKLVITYGTTLKHRQEVEQQRRIDMWRGLSNGTNDIMNTDAAQQTWFEKIMSCFQGMSTANTQTRIALATKAFREIQDIDKYPEVTNADKFAVREVLQGMIPDEKYSETVLNRLLNQCLLNLR